MANYKAIKVEDELNNNRWLVTKIDDDDTVKQDNVYCSLAANTEQNAQVQQASMQAKAQADAALSQQQALTKEKEIILQGVFDLAKANLPVPAELQQLVASMLQNVSVPIAFQNQQQEQALMQQQQQAEQQQMQQMQEEGAPQEMEMQQQ